VTPPTWEVLDVAAATLGLAIRRSTAGATGAFFRGVALYWTTGVNAGVPKVAIDAGDITTEAGDQLARAMVNAALEQLGAGR
jgi:hypothetical protein